MVRPRFWIACGAVGVAIAVVGVGWEVSRLASAESPTGGEALSFLARSRVPADGADGALRLEFRSLRWKTKETAIVVCDMWNEHWCAGATRRVAEMAPRMNEVLKAARDRGVFIVHAPSSTLAHYEGHPARRRAAEAPRAPDLPEGIAGWCGQIPAETKGTWPVDQSDGGCDCEPQCKSGNPWTRQIETIEIREEDAISDSGVEIWNLFAARGIQNVILLGVHTNMCVIGRPFGLRNLVRFGKNVVLMRDLTDTMYNSRSLPFVNHFTGTDLVVEHIETYVCPTVTSSALTAKPPFRFAEDKRSRVVVLSAESEYGAAETMPRLASLLERHGGLAVEVLQGSTAKSGDERDFIPGMEALGDADLVVVFVRRRALPALDMKRLQDYVARGKPVVALRTASHAFAPRETRPGLDDWPEFDREVLGCKYSAYPHGETRVTVAPEAIEHPIVAGLQGPYQVRETLYRSAPLASTCKVLLWGRCVNGEGDDPRYRKDSKEEPDQPIAWVNQVGGSRVFYTCLGSIRASFQDAWYRRMLVNAVFWALDRPAPEGAVKAAAASGSVTTGASS